MSTKSTASKAIPATGNGPITCIRKQSDGTTKVYFRENHPITAALQGEADRLGVGFDEFGAGILTIQMVENSRKFGVPVDRELQRDAQRAQRKFDGRWNS
jgi:hypothetical protein